MSDIMKLRGVYKPIAKRPSAPSPPPVRRAFDPSVPVADLTAEDIYRMPSVEEVVKAGYPVEKHASVARERDEFIQRFNSDPTFAADVRAQVAASRARGEMFP